MPRVGPGDDNITGDRYTLDLGVEPDLGNLLQNLTVANDLLDAAEQKFRDISDIVQSSTQRMAQFTRQTALAAAEAQRLQNSYSQMASSSFTLANIGGMAMGGMGGMGGYFPGQQAFGGMPPIQQNMIQTMPSGIGSTRPGEDIPEYNLPPPAKAASFPLSVRASALENLGERYTGGAGRIGKSVNKFRYGWQMARHGAVAEGVMERSGVAAADAAQIGPRMAGGAFLTDAAQAAKLGPIASAMSKIPGIGGAIGAGGEAAGALGALGGAVGTAAPWVAAAVGAYKLWAGQQAEGRRYSGITGQNYGLTTGTGGGTLGLKARSLWGNLVNPGVDYGRIQEEALGTGAVGQTYDQTRDFLFEAAKRGMSDTVDMVDLYREGVQKAGGTTTQLTESLDSLRAVAGSTNANLTAMTKNFKSSMETYTALGIGGSTAMSNSLITATANARYSAVAQANPALISSGGYDISNPYLRSQMTAGLGINYNQLGTTVSQNPVMAGKLPMLAEKAAAKGLQTYGFKDGMTYGDIMTNLQNSGLGDMAGQVFAQMGLLDPSVDPNNLKDVAMSIQTTMGRPEAEATRAMQSSGDEQTLQYRTAGGGGRGAAGAGSLYGTNIVGGKDISTMPESMRKSASKAYVESTLGIEMRGGGVFGIGEHDNAWMDEAQMYESQINQTGKVSPIFDEILKGMQGGNQFYVQGPDGSTVELSAFQSAHGDWQDLLRDQKSGYTIASVDASKQQALAGASDSEKKQIYSDLGWGTGDQLAAGKLPTEEDKNAGPSPGSTGTQDLGAHTIANIVDPIVAAIRE